MVQLKQKKSKQKAKPHAKKHGKKADLTEFRSYLDALGLKIVEVTADGNCFFRALADQLEGNEEEHRKYRLMVVQYIVKHKEEFEPFIEDEVPFDEYCQSMEEDGTWAGNMELQACSLVTHSNICIHRMMSPRWYIRNFDGHAARMIHLSYHNEEHYNSVRSKEDPCSGPAKTIVIKADADLSATSSKAKASATKSTVRSSKIADSGSVKQVMLGSGCEDAHKAEQILQLVDNDVDDAIELLIAEQEVEYDLIGNDEHPCKDVTPGHDEDRDCKLPEMPQIGTANNDMKPSIDDKRSQSSDKSIPRNKVCPCGSKKKYKSCCGSVKGKSVPEFVISHKVAPVMGRKERKQGKKGEASKNVSYGRLNREDPNPPDMGSLCI